MMDDNPSWFSSYCKIILFKYQTPSTKFQIKYKFQYPMTKCLEFYRWTRCYKTPYLLEQFIDCPFFEEIKPV